MADEFWATFSIFDHRASLYRNALVLFDRAVIPVPTRPVSDITLEEIEQLSAEVAYLEEHDAAIRFDWDPDEFQQWQNETVDREAVARLFAKDPPYATRLQVSDKYKNAAPELLPEGVESVKPVPVYGSRTSYDSIGNLDAGERKTFEIVLKHLSVPAQDAPLEDIIRLRQRPQFRDSLVKLRRWQTEVLHQLLLDPSDRTVRAAGKDLERWITEYETAMDDAAFKRDRTAVVSILALGGILAGGASTVINILSALAAPLFAVKDIVRPCWKDVADKDCAPAGVIYAASEL